MQGTRLNPEISDTRTDLTASLTAQSIDIYGVIFIIKCERSVHFLCCDDLKRRAVRVPLGRMDDCLLSEHKATALFLSVYKHGMFVLIPLF